jgi:DNA-binding response OmpR family regulator
MATVLLVDDEPSLLEILETYLKEEGFGVRSTGDGESAVEIALRERPDLILLDLTLPKLSGIEVFRRIRAESGVPVIMLTGRSAEVDRIVGLELGADDYVSKPFSPREVVARVKTVLRRSSGEVRTELPRDVRRVGDLEIDLTAHEVRRGGDLITLTPTEFRILDALASHVGRAFTRDQLFDKLGNDGQIFDRTLDRHVANLRQKIEPNPSRPAYLLTVVGVGYKLVSP